MTSFHIHSFVVFHTDLQKNTVVTCILTSQNHIMSNMQDCLLQLMQLIQYCYVSLFSTVITNEFIGEEFYPSPCWKKGVLDPPHCIMSVILTPAWILPPSYMDRLPGSINQSKVYRNGDFILEVSSGGETTFSYVANLLLIQRLQDLSTLCQICENQSMASLCEFIHHMNSRYYMNSYNLTSV
jgi:hypothetical protein